MYLAEDEEEEEETTPKKTSAKPKAAPDPKIAKKQKEAAEAAKKAKDEEKSKKERERKEKEDARLAKQEAARKKREEAETKKRAAEEQHKEKEKAKKVYLSLAIVSCIISSIRNFVWTCNIFVRAFDSIPNFAWNFILHSCPQRSNVAHYFFLCLQAKKTGVGLAAFSMNLSAAQRSRAKE